MSHIAIVTDDVLVKVKVGKLKIRNPENSSDERVLQQGSSLKAQEVSINGRDWVMFLDHPGLGIPKEAAPGSDDDHNTLIKAWNDDRVDVFRNVDGTLEEFF